MSVTRTLMALVVGSILRIGSLIILKSKDEIINEINLAYASLNRYSDFLRQGKIDEEIYESRFIQMMAYINGLRWCLGDEDLKF